MTATLPEPVPLDPPPGDPAVLGHLVERVAGTSFLLAVLQADLQGPAGRAPGWEGDDAAAAAAQIGVVVGLAGEISAVLCTAAGRLSLHRDRLEDVRNRLRVLRAQQEDDFAAAWGRLSAVPDLATAMRADAAPVVAVVEEVRAAEARRRREHAALLDEVSDDAAATRRVLAECSRVVGGTGRPGDEARAVAHLSLLLPDWGEAELAARGAELAVALGRLPSPEEREALAREAIALAHLPAFATALLAGMGAGEVGTTLFLLGEGDLGESSAALLAAALGAAVRTGRAADPVGDVLDARYVDPDDLGSESDAIALGMGAVLAASPRNGSRGPALATVVAWGGQLLARERTFAADHRGSRAVDRAYGPGIPADVPDPLQLVAERLAQAPGGAAAELLAGVPAWERLLARPWDDGGEAFARLVERAGAEPGPAGDAAVRSGLTALGAGLDDGDPGDWTVDRDTAAVVAPALTRGVAAHVQVAVDALWVGVDRSPAPDALRGLGYLTVDRTAAAAVQQALTGWAGEQPVPHTGRAETPDLPAFAVMGAYVAVDEYGQRLGFALDEHELQARAELAARRWDWTVGLLAGMAPGPIGIALGVLEGYGAMALDVDGTWDSPGDTGLVFDRGDAVRAGIAALPPDAAGVVREAANQAATGFDRAAGALGVPEAPRSPEAHWWGPVVEAFIPGLADAPPFLRRLTKEMRDEGVLLSPVR